VETNKNLVFIGILLKNNEERHSAGEIIKNILFQIEQMNGVLMVLDCC